MNERVRLAIVGCGGMGRRHLAGIAELERSGHGNVTLAAVCDLDPTKAESLAAEAETLLGYRPQEFTDLAVMAAQTSGLEAAVCTVDTGVHHRVAAALLDQGLHTMCEKPLALTIRACNQVIEAAQRNDRLLSVAENFRRDPINRLVRALLDDGAIGNRQFVMETSVSGRNQLFITPWRHMKLSGALTLDAGVHNADILQYCIGDPATAFGQTRLYEQTRVKGAGAGPGGFWEAWVDDIPETIEPTGEDAMFGLITFANGAIGQWVFHSAGHGLPFAHRMIFGTHGSIAAPGDRNGRPIRLTLDDGTDIADGRILDHAPSYCLSPVAAALFGDDRVWTYDFDFVTTDRKIVALEYHEFAECIRHDTPPEVDGTVARQAVALVYSLFESQLAGRPVTIDEVIASEVDAYQREIDEHLGLVATA